MPPCRCAARRRCRRLPAGHDRGARGAAHCGVPRAGGGGPGQPPGGADRGGDGLRQDHAGGGGRGGAGAAGGPGEAAGRMPAARACTRPACGIPVACPLSAPLTCPCPCLCPAVPQVPQFILEDAWYRGRGCRVVCTQPRRISAVSGAACARGWRGAAACSVGPQRSALARLHGLAAAAAPARARAACASTPVLAPQPSHRLSPPSLSPQWRTAWRLSAASRAAKTWATPSVWSRAAAPPPPSCSAPTGCCCAC